jgi:NADH-quinone oxidoreductase subunit N
VDRNILVLLPQLVLIAAAFLVLAADLRAGDRKDSKAGLSPWAVALLGPVAALVTLPLWTGQGEFWGRMWLSDRFSLFFQVLVYSVMILVLLESAGYVRAREIHGGVFYALILLAGVGMTMMASSRELLTIYIGLELMSVSFYALVGMMKNDDHSNEAAIKYYLMGAASSAVLLFGISLLYGLTGTTYLPEISSKLFGLQGTAALPAVWAAVLLLFVALGFKVAAVPFHMWTPDAYQGAPTPITAYLSVGSKAAAFAALIRVFSVGLPVLTDLWQPALAVVAVVTMTYGNVVALSQTDVKRMMGYSSIAHAGYILTGLAVFTPESLSATLYYLLAYAFTNLGVFAVIVLVASRRGNEEIRSFRGLGQASPAHAAALTLFFLSLVGIPPTAGFLGKFYLFFAMVKADYIWLAVVMVINSVISLPYYYGVVRQMWLEPVEEPEGAMEGAQREPGWLPADAAVAATATTVANRALLGIGPAVAVTALAVLLLGLYPQPFIDWVRQVTLL